MKKQFLARAKSTLVVAAVSLISLASFTGCDDDENDNVNNTPYNVTGNANSAQTVPAGTATGTGAFTGTYNPQTMQLNYTSTWSGLTGAPTSGSFYNGATGVSGTAMGSAWTFDTGATGTGTRTGTMTLTEQQETQLLAGNWYYGYGTTANTNGEIRGQLTAVR